MNKVIQARCLGCKTFRPPDILTAPAAADAVYESPEVPLLMVLNAFHLLRKGLAVSEVRAAFAAGGPDVLGVWHASPRSW